METRKTAYCTGLNCTELDNYEKPECMVYELECEGIMCSSDQRMGGSVSDPEMRDEAVWPGFNRW